VTLFANWIAEPCGRIGKGTRADAILVKRQVNVHDDIMTGRDQLLRPSHGLMRRALRPKAEAVLGERRVPFCLQHLQNRLLDEAVEHRRDAERPCAARCLWYLHTPHRLRLVGTLKQLGPKRGPVLRHRLQGDLQFSFLPHHSSEIAVLLAVPSFIQTD
jgi:hypothetical protein